MKNGGHIDSQQCHMLYRQLRPQPWKSDPHLNQKHANRCEKDPTNDKPDIIKAQPLSKSSDWTEVDLEVPEKEEHVHLRNPKLSIIFNKDDETPTPPPRKLKKNFREKLEAVAKNGLQAFQQKKPVEEEVFVKKHINYGCPLCDKDEKEHNRDHHHHHHNHENVDDNKNIKNDSAKNRTKRANEKKNLSVISLPNYNELKLTVANPHDIDKKSDTEKGNDSIVSLPNETKKTPAPADVESDDSFGGLEDWDLGLIEHYNPKDASLPRPRKIQRNSKDVLSDIESLIVKEEDVEKPQPPVRRSETLVKKINREASESAHKRSNEFPSARISKSPTPPPSPVPKRKEEPLFLRDLPTVEDGKVEHSSLMKILEAFSIRDRQSKLEDEKPPETMDLLKAEGSSTKASSNQSSLTPSLLEFEKNMAVNSVEEFINAEKS
ncbi:hypothetical protein NQ317_015724 [Molorchus minor]|uniref:Uncharacterized protein n=1 Tax=Molorchus minor TaxID=1323400 RepID=A0ABQ9IZ83_9CUCU|nr:hypothetical protein NQ317_015724 [Molorchus minor]